MVFVHGGAFIVGRARRARVRRHGAGPLGRRARVRDLPARRRGLRRARVAGPPTSRCATSSPRSPGCGTTSPRSAATRAGSRCSGSPRAGQRRLSAGLAAVARAVRPRGRPERRRRDAPFGRTAGARFAATLAAELGVPPDADAVRGLCPSRRRSPRRRRSATRPPRRPTRAGRHRPRLRAGGLHARVRRRRAARTSAGCRRRGPAADVDLVAGSNSEEANLYFVPSGVVDASPRSRCVPCSAPSTRGRTSSSRARTASPTPPRGTR